MSTDIIPSDQPLPPQDVPAEQSVLGAMMLSKDAIGTVVDVIRGRDFYRPAHQAIFEAILDLYGRGEPADAITVVDELQRRHELDRIGGAPYIHTLLATVPTAANAEYYAEIVDNAAVRRRIAEASLRTHLHAMGDGDVDELIADAEAAMFAATQRRDTTLGVDLDDVLQSTMDEIEAIAAGTGEQGVKTGFADLDAVTNGLKPGELTIVAARPGVGKSTLGLDMMRACSIHQGKRSVLFSLEMGRNEVVMRLLSAETQVRLGDMRGGRITDNDRTRLKRGMEQVQGAPMHIDDDPNLTMAEIRSRARRQAARGDLGVIVVDYLQLMTSGKRVESRQQEVSEFSRNLKLLAKELDVPVVAISQLNRGPEQRTDKKPQLGDLRESGSLEQDADVVILIHRPDAADLSDPRMGETDLILAKHRAGPTSTITVAHQLHYSRFADMAQDLPPAPADLVFDRDNVRRMDPVDTEARPSASKVVLCVGCRDRLDDPVDIDAGFHRDTCDPHG